MNHANLRKALFAAALVAGLGTVPFAQVQAQDSAAAASKGDNQTVVDKTGDTWITTKVKSEFAANKGVKGSDISVSTTEGVVTLTGTVASAKQKSHATAVAKKVKGVKSVDATGLTVSAAAASN